MSLKCLEKSMMLLEIKLQFVNSNAAENGTKFII